MSWTNRHGRHYLGDYMVRKDSRGWVVRDQRTGQDVGRFTGLRGAKGYAEELTKGKS